MLVFFSWALFHFYDKLCWKSSAKLYFYLPLYYKAEQSLPVPVTKMSMKQKWYEQDSPDIKKVTLIGDIKMGHISCIKTLQLG